ncbi:Uncharacterised protein [Bordetella pertussis]|nr:Uncharacterised protein [Bordetella pertussis]CFW28692.1 Uncharacterised protein [Bordetella pertussis]
MPGWPWRGAAHSCRTLAKAVSTRTCRRAAGSCSVRAKARRRLRSECEGAKSAHASTMRGSGLHHRMGSPSAYQGKMPCA